MEHDRYQYDEKTLAKLTGADAEALILNKVAPTVDSVLRMEADILHSAEKLSEKIKANFIAEIQRLLLRAGPEVVNEAGVNILLGVALENLASDYLYGERDTESYKDLTRF